MRNKHRKQRRAIKRMERMRFEALPFWEQMHCLVGRMAVNIVHQQARVTSTLLADVEAETPPTSAPRERRPFGVLRGPFVGVFE